MTCELKFIRPAEMPDVRYVTCTHPDHTWAVIAPGTGTAKAKVEHGKHLRAVPPDDPALCGLCGGAGDWQEEFVDSAGGVSIRGGACLACDGTGLTPRITTQDGAA